MPILTSAGGSTKGPSTAPTIGTATAGNMSASVTFTAPSFSKLPITSYTVTSSSGRTGSGSSSPVTVNEIAGGTYTYTVRASNGNAISPASSSSNSLTFAVPAAPTVSSFTDGGTGTSGTLAFSLNSSNNSTITNVKWSIDNVNYTSAGTTTSPITLTGLTAGSYTFYLKATNALGDSTAGSVAGTVFTPTSFESIATLSGDGSSATVTFNSIPSTYKSLQIRMLVRDTGTSGNFGVPAIRLNGDTTANYSSHEMIGTTSAISASGVASRTSMDTSGSRIIPDSSLANYMGVAIIDITDYASTSKNKTVRWTVGANTSGFYGVSRIGVESGHWRNTSAVNSISILLTTGNAWTTTSTFALYGVK
jgi:hypothetical protein